MKQFQKIGLIFIIILITGILTGLIDLVRFSSGLGLSSFLGGAGGSPPVFVSSISQVAGTNVSIISNDSELADTRFLVDLTVGQSGNDTITGNYFQVQTNQTNVTATNTVEINVQSVREYLQANVSSAGASNLRDFTATYGTGFLHDICPANTIVIPVGILDKYCVSINQRGLIGTWPNVTQPINQTVTLGLKINGSNSQNTEISNTVTNADIRDLAGNYLGTAYYLGSTPNQNVPQPNFNNYVPVQTPDTSSQWHIGARNDYENYMIEYDRIHDQLMTMQSTGAGPGFDLSLGPGLPVIHFAGCNGNNCAAQFAALFQPLNTSVNNLSSLNTQISIPNANIVGGPLSEGTPTNSFFRVELQNQLFNFPHINYRLTANTLGLQISVGQPEIQGIQPSCLTFPLNEPGVHSYAVNLRNVGSGRANFNANLVNCTGIVGTAEPITLNPNETGTMIVNANSNPSATPTQATCSIRVYDSSHATHEDTASICYQITQSTECQYNNGNNYDYRGNNVYRCNTNGQWDLYFNCAPPRVIQVVNGVPVCSDHVDIVCGDSVCTGNEADEGSANYCPSDCVSGTCNKTFLSDNCPLNEDTCTYSSTPGYHVVVKGEKKLFLGLIDLGETTTTYSCEKDIDYTLLIIAVIAGLTIISVVFIGLNKRGRK